MKKLLAMALVLALLTVSLPVLADYPATLTALLEENSIPSTRNIDVPADIMVKQNGTYTDGPANVVLQSVNDPALTDFKATLYMQTVRTAFNAYYTAAELLVAGGPLAAELPNCKVTGEFEITITYPQTVEAPASVVGGFDMVGFNAEASGIFTETHREEITNADDTKSTVITLAVSGPDTGSGRPGYVLASQLDSNLLTYLPDITFECIGAKITSAGTHVIKGEISGYTEIKDNAGLLVGRINYVGKQGTGISVTGTSEITETVTAEINQSGGGNVVIPSGPSGPSGPATPPAPSEDVKVEFHVPEAEEDIKPIVSKDGKEIKVNLDEINPEREGFAFGGFYLDKNKTQPAEGEITVTESTILYGDWVNITAPEVLNSDDHTPYIKGYPDGTVRPNDNITREEIATIFFRLLRGHVREEILTSDHDFTDVEADKWSNEAIATMASGGYLTGYADGSFRPEGDMTRAEFATIAYRVLGKQVEGSKGFADIEGHWAEEAILAVANNEWIDGYPDESFRPDAYITRAEAITIVNRMLVRYADHEIAESKWPDNNESDWYYHAINEAAIDHGFDRKENKYDEAWIAE